MAAELSSSVGGKFFKGVAWASLGGAPVTVGFVGVWLLGAALTETERRKAEKHLKDCEYCNTRYRFEEKLRQRVVLVMVEPMPPALKQRLSQLRLEL